jgi:hypothetical protein
MGPQSGRRLKRHVGLGSGSSASCLAS